MNTLAYINTLCLNVGGRLSWELEDSCWPGSHGSRRCRPGFSSQPSQQDTGLALAVQGLEEHTENDVRVHIRLHTHTIPQFTPSPIHFY